MNIQKTIYLFLFFSFTCLYNYSCKKQDEFLNKKRDLGQVVPSTIADFQALVDNNLPMNNYLPTGGYAGIDNMYMTDVMLDALGDPMKSSYLFEKDLFKGITYGTTDWDNCYSQIEITNIALNGLEKITVTDQNRNAYNNAKGCALFFRSLYFYGLSQLFCKPYDSVSAATDLGIVIRLSSDVNQKSTRSTVKETYDRMITDLKEAASILPVTPTNTMRPSAPAANALLAKIYLSAGDYRDALTYASNFLNQFNVLIDFNNTALIDPTATLPFPVFPKHPEICFYADAESGIGIYEAYSALGYAVVDSILYSSYDANDLRKQVFFDDQGNGNVFFKGTYTGFYYPFAGIATNEILLIRAECNVRLGNTAVALNDLNALLQKRYKSGTYSNLSISDPLALLSKILLERRKELPFTNQVRWEDLRRLNKDPRFAVTVKHIYNGQTYTLAPNDPRYVWPIPDLEVQLSGIPQNIR